MNEKDLISTVTIKQVSEGGDSVRADLKASASAQDQLASSSENLAVVTENSAKRQTSAAAAFDAYTRRVDPASRALADFEKSQQIVNRAFEQNPSLLDRAGQGIDTYTAKLNTAAVAAENLRRQQSNLSTNTSTPSPSNPTQITGVQLSSVNTRDYAAQFEAAAVAQDNMVTSATRLNSALNPLEVEQGRLASQLGVYKSALDAGLITQAQYASEQTIAGQALEAYATKLNAASVAAENLRRQQSNISTNTTVSNTSNPTQITGAQLSNVNTTTYAAQFEAAAKANDDMMASVARLTAALNPFEAEQGRIAAQMVTYKAALDAGKISQDVFAAETEKANLALAAYADKLNTAATAAENLRRQQSNLSTNTTVANTSNPTQITGQQLSNVDTKLYAAQFEAAAKAQDDQTASLVRLRAEMNPLEVAQGKLGAQSAMYNAALKSGALTSAEYATAQAMLGSQLGSAATMAKSAAAATGDFGLAAGIGSTQAMALFAALRHMFDATAAGIPITRVMAMEIGNLSYGLSGAGGIMSGVGAVFAKIGSFLSPVTLLVGGLTALGAAAAYVAVSWSNAQREIERALTGIGQRTGTTSDDINKFAAANASATGLSISQARTAAIELTKTGDISISGLKGVGDAIHGFAVMTGTTAVDATKVFAKALGGDAVQAAEEFNKSYGFLDASTRDYIRTLEMQGDRSKAMQVILDAMAKDNQKAADSVGILSKAWAGLGNILASIKTPPAVSLPDQITALQQQKTVITNTPSTLGGNYGQVENFVDPGIAAKTAALAEIDKEIDALQKKLNEFTTEGVVKKLAEMSLAGDDVVRSTITQIAQLEKLQTEERALQDAQNTPGVKIHTNQSDAALVAIRNQEAALTESMATAARYNQRVAEISGSWGNVGQSTALALQALQNQLPVVQAVTGAAQMVAQYFATIANLTDQGKSHLDAEAIAAKQFETSVAAASAAVMKQVESLKDQNDMLRAQASNTEASTAAAIAYKNAINSGADEASAMALKVATAEGFTIKAAAAALQWQQNLLGVGAAAQQAAASIDAAVLAESDRLAADAHARNPTAGTFEPDPNNTISTGVSTISDAAGFTDQQIYATLHPKPPLPLSEVLGGIADSGASSGGLPGALSAVEAQQYASTDTEALTSQMSLVSQIVQSINSSTTDKATQSANLQQELAWLQTQPVTLAREQQIATLRSSIDGLTSSTNSLNSTNQDLLSPFYSQDPRTSHIGFRSQGMSSTGVIDNGYGSANDNTMAGTPTGGFIQSDLGMAGATSPQPMTGGAITLNAPITINVTGTADTNAIGRTVFQATQTVVRQLSAAR